MHAHTQAHTHYTHIIEMLENSFCFNPYSVKIYSFFYSPPLRSSARYEEQTLHTTVKMSPVNPFAERSHGSESNVCASFLTPNFVNTARAFYRDNVTCRVSPWTPSSESPRRDGKEILSFSFTLTCDMGAERILLLSLVCAYSWSTSAHISGRSS